MQAEQNKAIIQGYVDAFNTDWTAALEKYVSDESLAEHIRMMQQVLPGYRLELHDMIAEGDRVAVRATVRGFHQGELMGVPPTGREMSVSLLIIYRLAGGRIAEHWMQADQVGLMQQVTAGPAA
jgi:predicted ester cyclase